MQGRNNVIFSDCRVDTGASGLLALETLHRAEEEGAFYFIDENASRNGAGSRVPELDLKLP